MSTNLFLLQIQTDSRDKILRITSRSHFKICPFAHTITCYQTHALQKVLLLLAFEIRQTAGTESIAFNPTYYLIY